MVFRAVDPATQEAFEVGICCPLPSRLHPRHQELMVQHRQWAQRFGIPANEAGYGRYCDTRFDLLAAYQYFDEPVDVAQVHSHLMTWFFVFDDFMDMDHGLGDELRRYIVNLHERHLEVLDGAATTPSDAACVRAFGDFLWQASQLAGADYAFWYQRMVEHLREYLMGTYWESQFGPTTQENSNTALYLQVRHMAVGVTPCLDLMAMAARIPGKPFERNYFIRRLERLAINYSIWVNDLAGLNRDLKRGLGNVIFTLRNDHSLSLREAALMVGRKCDDELVAFLQVERQLPTLLGQDYVQNQGAYVAYVEVLKRWMRGLLDWSARSDRYLRLDVDMALQDHHSIREEAAE